jgi:ABC-type nitrate/sulfonate/bicarbonate transport system substrate-binding protein
VPWRALALLLAAAACALAAAGCGSSDTGAGPRPATLLLDFAPGGVHAGIYAAVARGYDRAEGVRLTVRAPPAGADPVRLLLGGRVQLAVLDIHDLALAAERGRDVVGVMPIVQQPLASVLARPGVRSPRALEGRRVGVTGLPSDDAVLRSVVAGDRGDPARVRTVTIGFNAVAALVSGRVQGATAFWNAEGLELRRRLPGARVFRVTRYGAPAYPELVLAVAGRTLREEPELVRGAMAALRRGYELALQDPASAVEDELQRTQGTDRARLRAELDAVSPALLDPAGRIGVFDRPALRRWARWEARFGITRRPPDVDRLLRAPAP